MCVCLCRSLAQLSFRLYARNVYSTFCSLQKSPAAPALARIFGEPVVLPLELYVSISLCRVGVSRSFMCIIRTFADPDTVAT